MIKNFYLCSLTALALIFSPMAIASGHGEETPAEDQVVATLSPTDKLHYVKIR